MTDKKMDLELKFKELDEETAKKILKILKQEIKREDLPNPVECKRWYCRQKLHGHESGNGWL